MHSAQWREAQQHLIQQCTATALHCCTLHCCTLHHCLQYKIQNTWQGSLPAALQLSHNLFHLSNFKGLQCHSTSQQCGAVQMAVYCSTQYVDWSTLLTIQQSEAAKQLKQLTVQQCGAVQIAVGCSTMLTVQQYWLFFNVKQLTFLQCSSTK